MLEFAWPWVFLALPLPWLVRRFLPPVRQQQAALRVPFLEDFEALQGKNARAGGRSLLALSLGILAWLLLVTAAARPQWQGEAVPLPMQGRDLMLAVDLSGSMAEEDFVIGRQRVDRLTATKIVAGNFIEKRKGDRVGLILFGEQAYLQAPLTYDLKTVKTLLDEAFINMAGQKTAIGDAIGLAIKRLRGKKGEKVLILMSDGENTAGAMDPLKAAELAAEEKLKIYTIGIRADPEADFFGMVRGRSALDEKTLTRIAQLTGGRYFRARDTAQLVAIYDAIDAMEPVENDERFFRPVDELFYWPAGASLVLALGLLFRRKG
ncbi:vWA domain-containing protein [Thiolapillus sp.]|uniref:vWA domain-containing protein n=1 Tax=Thiolapillus sp. TaxID=2017437 RepID=UPI003AF560AC